MADKFSKEKRSEIMSKIRSSNTKPELIHKAKNLHLDYQPDIFGRPDFADWKNKIVVFIDGCFWHCCPSHHRKPQSNREYWIPKLERNMIRAKEVEIAYKNSGWKVVRIWEHNVE